MHALHVADSRVFVQVLLLGCSSRDLEWVPLDSVRKVKRVGLRSLCATGDDVEAAEVLGAIRVWYKGRMVPPPPDLEVASGSAAGARSSGGRRKVWVQLGEGGDGPVVGFDEDADIPTRLRRPPMQQPLTEQVVCPPFLLATGFRAPADALRRDESCWHPQSVLPLPLRWCVLCSIPAAAMV